MWAGRAQLVTLQDALAVPSPVRRSLQAVLPVHEFTAYRVSERRASVVTNRDAPPYEVHLTFKTAVDLPGVVGALAGSRQGGHGRAATLLPPGADPTLPACRLVGRDRGAMDVLFPDAATPPTFPFLANVLTFSEEHALAGKFDCPLCVRPGVRLHLK